MQYRNEQLLMSLAMELLLLSLASERKECEQLADMFCVQRRHTHTSSSKEAFSKSLKSFLKYPFAIRRASPGNKTTTFAISVFPQSYSSHSTGIASKKKCAMSGLMADWEDLEGKGVLKTLLSHNESPQTSASNFASAGLKGERELGCCYGWAQIWHIPSLLNPSLRRAPPPFFLSAQFWPLPNPVLLSPVFLTSRVSSAHCHHCSKPIGLGLST